MVVTADLTRNIQRYNKIWVVFFIIFKSMAGKSLRYYTCTVTLRMKATVSWAKKGHFYLLYQLHIVNPGHGLNLAVLLIHLLVCLTTGQELLPKRALHIVRSRASSFKWEYPLLSIRSFSSFPRLLSRLPVTSIPPFIFPWINCCRRQFLSKFLAFCVYSFGYFPGVRLWFADVSEPSISSIFKGWM